jgi:hypothetical protein
MENYLKTSVYLGSMEFVNNVVMACDLPALSHILNLFTEVSLTVAIILGRKH